MHKSIKLYCDDLAFKALLSDALQDVADALDVDLDIDIGGDQSADLIICAEPYNGEAAGKELTPNILTYFIHLGRAAPDHDNQFDYKFLMPLRMGSLMDCVASILRGKVSGQIKRRLAIKNWEIQFPENRLKPTALDTTLGDIEITDTECQILRALYLADGAGVDKKTLLDEVWGYHQDVETHTLETHIYRLRKKLEIDPAAPEVLIITDQGYVLLR